MDAFSSRQPISLDPRVVRAAGLVDRFLLPAALAVIPLGYFTLMAIGLVRWYTPVPFWDMWDAYLSSYIEYLDGNWRGIFNQTNEHRIWFSNILFFLDLEFLKGRALLLVPANGLLTVAVWATLALIARHLLKDRPGLWLVVALCLGPFCFSWLQEQNLYWGFQSQFFVAYLFPLAAFACLAMSYASPRGRAWFIAAIAFGLASLGTMANGLLALPFLIVMIFAMPNPSWRRAAVIAAIAVAAYVAWFQGYFLVERDRASLVQAVTFIYSFFGLPVAPIVLTEPKIHVAGVIFIASSLGFALYWFRARRTLDPMVLALITFIAYVGASCFIIAIGRAAIQPNAAMISRYATPSLIAWAALVILYAYVLRRVPLIRWVIAGLGVYFAWGLLPTQRLVFTDLGPEYVHQRWIGGLALKMRVLDLESIDNVYPTTRQFDIDHIRNVAARADRDGLTIMGDEAFTAAVASVGKPAAGGFHVCPGVLEVSEVIKEDENYRRVLGWVFDDRVGRVPLFAYVVENGVIEGVVVTGSMRHDVARIIDPRGAKAGFTGFVRASAAGTDAKMYCAD